MKLLTPLFVFTLLLFVGCNKNTETVEPAISVFEQTFDEGDLDNTVQVVLSLSIPATSDLSVEVFTTDATAKAGVDYESFTGVVSVSAGEQEAYVDITLLGDTKFSPDKEFYVNLKRPVGTRIDVPTARIIVKNDDENVLNIPDTGYETPDTYDGMTLIWSDEFEGESLSPENWTHEIGNGLYGWGNLELQYYTNQNDRIVDGNLVIEAREESRNGYNYTSTRIITQDKVELQYGRIDIRAVMPYGKGIWPALWMLGANFDTVGWPYCGEIDIMEMVGGGDFGDSEVHGTVHWDHNDSHAQYGNSTKLESGKLNDEFHVYSIEWDEEKITWYFDDQAFNVIDITPNGLDELRQPFFFIFNIAVGGNWPGSPDDTTIFPQWMVVDYVRVFQKN